MPEQLCNRSQNHSGHNQSTGKCMAVAMPGIFPNRGLFECGREPSARSLEGIARALGRKDWAGFRSGLPAPQLLERAQGDRIQRNGARISVLGPNQMELPRSKSTWFQRRPYCSLMRIPVWIESREWGRNSAKRRSMAARKRFSSGSDKNLTRPPPSVLFRMRAAGFRSIFSLSRPTRKIKEKVACQRFAVVAAHSRSSACSVSHSTISFLRMESAGRDPNTGRS